MTEEQYWKNLTAHYERFTDYEEDYEEDYNDYICGCCGDHTSNVTWNEDLERDECNHCLVDNLKGK